jgi:hypothetical protein
MLEKIYRLSRKLWPTGRAFRVPFGGTLDKITRVLVLKEFTAVNGSKSILNSILADNDNFNSDDATDWNIRLGMIVNASLDIEVRRSAIIRKYNHPGNIKARQNYRYLERELRLAGFDVYVHENRFDDGMYGLETRSPAVVSSTTGVQNQLGMYQLGQQQLGYNWTYLVANKITQIGDIGFDVGSKKRRTFFIGGETVGSFANVDANREKEFRELILKIKPVQTIGFLFINYV